MLVHDRLVRRLEHLASVDELTGALMRRACLMQAERALRTAVRTGRPLSLAMIDLDRFKAINDSRGHAAGDRVLKHFGGLIGGSLRASDVFGRMGGEEFIVICPETTQAEGVKMLERMQRLIQRVPCVVDGTDLVYTFSAGVGVYKPGESLAELMARVDETLYVAKSRGRDCIVEAPPEWRVDKPSTVGAEARAAAAGAAAGAAVEG